MTSKYFLTLALTTSILIALLLSADAKSVSQRIKERIVTDSETLLIGVPIDYSYNESHVRSDSSDGLSSVPGCPKSDEGYPWVYFGSPPKCYLAGERRPCDGNQKLFVKSGSTFGFCSCECIEGIQMVNPLEDQFCKPTSGGDWELVHVGELEKCFTTFEQGPCGEDEWIVKAAENETDTTKKTFCEKRTCPIGQGPFVKVDGKQECDGFYVFFKGVAFIVPNRESCKSNGMQYSKLRNRCVHKIKKLFI